MYTPINWANPDNLKLITQKKEANRLETFHVSEKKPKKIPIKTKLIDTLNQVFGLRLKPIFEM